MACTATSKAAVDNAYTAALANGGTDNGPQGLRPQFGDSYYAANLLDPDRYGLEVNFKPWLHDGPDTEHGCRLPTWSRHQ